MPPPLTAEILERFRGALQAAGAPLGQSIEQGLWDEQIDQLAMDFGVSVPPELRTLWRWGQPSAAAGRDEGGWDTDPRFELWPAAEAAGAIRSYRSAMPELANHIAFCGAAKLRVAPRGRRRDRVACEPGPVGDGRRP